MISSNNLTMELTQDYLRQTYDYRNDGRLVIKKTTHHKHAVGDVIGSIHKGLQRYIVSIKSKKYLAARIIFFWHHGYLPECVDHRDRNGLNDRIDNLRAATKAENCKNRTAKVNGSSKYLGVILSYNNKWLARIRVDGKNKRIGLFQNEEDAALAYNREAVRYHGEFASINIINKNYASQ